ncbi:MAG TPA: bifunctional helix-turn-helix transcriptional regulator/GNAT family N-acetyltransferase, partial [Synergistales bacterium]|nr:bifunctional helix-turn-helix transcriptional regulator/GNAT family N-acetyltransferase [Synergistales bacterium]
MPEEIGTGVIERIREFNRFYTRVIGLHDRYVLSSPFSLSEARVLYEVSHQQKCTAKALMTQLGLDAGYLSRMIRKFEKEGLLTRVRSDKDGRIFFLKLTNQGRKALDSLEQKLNREIRRRIKNIPGSGQRKMAVAMAAIQEILGDLDPDAITVRPYRSGELGYISWRHSELYREEYGFGDTFEFYLIEGMYKFLNECQGKGEVWVLDYFGQVVGSIAIVETDPDTAQLRWFLIEPEFRGMGLGKKLM